MTTTPTLTWQEQLDAVGRRGDLPPGGMDVMARTFSYIADVAPGLPVGVTAPDFTLPDQHGRPVSLAALRARGPVVAVFYRGAWCPYCNVVLSAMNAHLRDLHELGASLVAISPQKPERGAVALAGRDLGFPVLTDADQSVIAAYRLGFETPADQQELVRRAFGLDLAAENADGSWRLPATATYVIAADGRIAAGEVTAAPNRRMSPAAVLAALRDLA